MQAAGNILPGHQVSTAAAKIQTRLVASYGKLPLSFEANDGQVTGPVKFISRGQGYALFLTGDEAVLSLHKTASIERTGTRPYTAGKPAGAGVAPTFRSADALLAGHHLFDAVTFPDLLPSAPPMQELENAVEKPWDRRSGPALPFFPSRLADSGGDSAVLRMRLVGANTSAAVTGADELPGRSNYFIGNDPKKWRTNVPNYAKVKYAGVYPGVDLVYYGNQGGQLEYDFVVAPGADPSVIALDVAAGLSRHPSNNNGEVKPPLQITSDGDLVVKTDGGEVRFHKPVVYQPEINNGQRTTDDRQQTPVDGHYVLRANNQVGFNVPSYDHTRSLCIDPVVIYSTYLGGNAVNWGLGIAADPSGNAYVTGFTSSTDFPTVNPLQASQTSSNEAAFVAKLNAAGSALVYSTYLGGSNYGTAIAVDSSGNAYVAGETGSAGLPTVNPIQATCNNPSACAFIAKLNAAGSALVYSTYLGGSNGDYASGIAVDSSGKAYVTGVTSSTDFPTVNPLQATNRASMGTAFVAKLNAAGTALVYSTYLGGSNSDQGDGIAVDSSGNAYVTGTTGSTDFPTANPIQATCRGCPDYSDAFVSKLNAAGSALVYSTYLGGDSFDGGAGIAVDSSGNAYVTGLTSSTDFPTVNPLQATNRGSEATAFVTKLNAAGSALVYSTYLGGSTGDAAFGIAVDPSGNAYLVGSTLSADFPTVNAFQASIQGGDDAFVAMINPTGSALVYSSYLGGLGSPMGVRGLGIAADSLGNAYVTGNTELTDFPTVNPLQASNNGFVNAFVAKISPVPFPLVSLSATSLAFGTQLSGTTSAGQTETVTNSGTADLIISTFTIGGTNASDFAESADTCMGATVVPSGTCMVNVTFSPAVTGPLTGTLTITDNNNRMEGNQQTVSLSGIGITPSGASLSPTMWSFGGQLIDTASAVRKVTLTSTGTTNLTPSISITGANAGDFRETNNCPASMAPGAKCTINLTYAPTIVGAERASLTVTDSAANSPQTVALSGTGVPPVTLSGSRVNFGDVGEKSPSAAKEVKLTNRQTVALTIWGISTASTDFRETNTCGGTLAVGGQCTITITFTPSILGPETANLTVLDRAANCPQTVTLTGTGVLPATLSETTVNFGSVEEKSPSTAKDIILTNRETMALNITRIATGNPDFTETNTCGGSVAARGHCTITVTFTPSIVGPETGTLTVDDAASNSPQTASLSGTGK